MSAFLQFVIKKGISEAALVKALMTYGRRVTKFEPVASMVLERVYALDNFNLVVGLDYDVESCRSALFK